jgi:predicted phage terminase large subunit-like protein
LLNQAMKAKANRVATRTPLERTAALRMALAECLADDLAAFAKKSWTILQPHRRLIWSWHYDYLCEQLTLVKQRKLLRLIVNIPPRTLKSILITILFPVWVWITNPEHDFLTASYSLDLSTEHSLMRRYLLRSPWFRRLWSDKFRLADGRNQAGQFMNDKRGQMIATSVGATAMGRGCDTAILDDPVSAVQVVSDAERTKANNWIDTTLRSRLNDPSTGAIILVMQRLHELDATGFLLEQEPGAWTHVRIPLEAEEDETWTFPISGRIVQRKAGDILMPERFTPAVVEQQRAHRLVFAGQYQQRPVPAEGNIIKRVEVRYYGGIDPRTGQPDEKLPENFDRKIISADCAFKDLANSDYVAIAVIGIKGRKRYILNIVNQHLDAAATEAEIRRQRAVHHPISAVLVEDRANGPAVIQRLKVNLPGVIEINPQGGKIARMAAVGPEWQAGDWYVDRNAGWTESFIEQITTFPNSAHDDMADAMSQASAWLLQTRFPSLRISNAFTGEVLQEFF